jgi:hypothetical protein
VKHLSALAAAAALTVLGGCGPQLAEAGAAGAPQSMPTATFTPRPGSYCAQHPDDMAKCDPRFFTEMSPEYCGAHTTPPHCSTVMQCPVRPGPGEKAYPGIGILTGPPPADARPRITREQAIGIARRAGGMRDRQNRPVTPDANLRSLTYGGFPGCRAKHRYGRKLAWVVTNHEAGVPVGCACCGPCPGQLPPAERCDQIVFVDAMSGRNLDGVYTTCPGTPRGSVN